jgi:hypothetical protein
LFGWLQYLNNCLMTFSSSFYFQFYCDDPLQKWNNSKFLKKITDHWQVPQIFFWYKLKSITAGLKLNTSLYFIRRSIILYTGLKLNTSLYLIRQSIILYTGLMLNTSLYLIRQSIILYKSILWYYMNIWWYV